MEENYILENERESQRLGRQNSSRNYRVSEELSPIDYSVFPSQVLLDAGCGNAEVAKFVLEENRETSFDVHLCDISGQRIQDGIKRIHESIGDNFTPRVIPKVASLDCLDYQSKTFDKIFCRFVYQHLQKPQEVTGELHRVLKNGGELIIIDANGILFDLVTENDRLNTLIKKLQIGITNFEPYVCGKIIGYLHKAGFNTSYVNTETQYMQFVSPFDRENEAQLYKERFTQIMPTIKSILDESAEEFVELFISELLNPSSFLQYDKKIIRAVKIDHSLDQ